MTPGHIPIITNQPLAFNPMQRLFMWRIRTAIYAGADAPDLFAGLPSPATRRALSPEADAARPGRKSPPDRGTYSAQAFQDDLASKLDALEQSSKRTSAIVGAILFVAGAMTGALLFGQYLA